MKYNYGSLPVDTETALEDPEVTPEDGSFYYVREPGGDLIARVDEDDNACYYHFDELGSTRLITNGSGTVTDTYTYDAWGKQTAHTGSTAQPYRFVGQLGYYSHYQDSNLFSQSSYQFLQLGVRFHDPLTGRFTQRDPLRDGMNWYVYVENLPTTGSDPTGYQTAGGYLRGQLHIDGSCSKMLDFLRRVDETDDTDKWKNVKTDTWYAVDVVHCYNATKSGGYWTNVKIPDGAMCEVSCSEKGCAPNKKWTIKLDCNRSWITRRLRQTFIRDDPDFPFPPRDPTMPRNVAEVNCDYNLK